MSSKEKNQARGQSKKEKESSKNRPQSKSGSKKSDVKGVQISDKRSQKLKITGSRSFNHSNNIRGSDKCYSEIECKSNTQEIGLMIKDDKTQKNHKLNVIDKQIEEELEKQEMVRDGLIKQSNIMTSKADKIKIASRFRKLVDTNHINLPIKVLEDSSIKRQEKEYHEIANDIKLNTLNSKVSIQSPGAKEGHILNKLVEEESFSVPSPSNINKQSTVNINVLGSPEAMPKTENHQEGNLLKINEENYDKQSLLKLDSEEEAAINESIERQYEKKGKEKTIQPIKINFNIENGCTIPDNNEPKLSKKEKLQLKFQALDCNVTTETPVVLDAKIEGQKLEQQIIELRKAVKQLRLQKVKERAQNPAFDDISSRLAKSEDKSRKRKVEPTLISDLHIDTEQINSSVARSQRLPIYFGRIRKNKSVSKPRQETYSTVQQFQTPSKIPIVFSSMKEKSEQRIPSHNRLRSASQRYPSQRSGSIQCRTLDLDRIVEENIDDSLRYLNPYGSIDNTSSKVLKKDEICEKIMNKFESDDKKFHKFMIREQSKSRNRSKKYDKKDKKEGGFEPIEPVNPQSSKSSGQILNESKFEGAIIKNIASPSVDISKFFNDPTLSFMEPSVMNEINFKEKNKLIKKQQNFTKIKIPQVPPPPTPHTTTDELMDLIMKVLPYSDQTYSNEELKHCTLRKYKNCVMFELPNNSNFRLVWYFSGKLYIGDWDLSKNEKIGEGIEYNKNKYFYKGEFENGKRNGKGIFIHSNGSIYEGQFFDGERNGKGKYFDAVNKSYYEGQWTKGKMNGLGYYEFQSSIFQGQFQDDFKQGFGTEYFHTGDFYLGEYAADKFHGQGKYGWTSGAFYIGHFKEGFRHDYGKWVSSGIIPEVYLGFYTKDKKQGSGKYVWENGCIYEGNFDNDLKHGIGNMQYPDGQWMQGIWTQGILTDVISKLSEAQLEDPLREPQSRQVQTHTRISVIAVGEDQN